MKLPLRPAEEILLHCRTNVIDLDGRVSHADVHYCLELLANPHGLKILRCGTLAYETLLAMFRGREIVDDRVICVTESGARSDVVLIDDQEAELPRDERFCAVIRNCLRPETL